MLEGRMGSKAIVAFLTVLLACAILKPIHSQGQHSVSLIVPKPAYPLGYSVTVYARVTFDGSPLPGAVVLWELKDPYGVRRDFGQATTNATGYATIYFATSPEWPAGAYNLTVAVSGTSARASATVDLKAVAVAISFSKPAFALIETIVAWVRVTLDGAPLAGAVVLWSLRTRTV